RRRPSEDEERSLSGIGIEKHLGAPFAPGRFGSRKQSGRIHVHRRDAAIAIAQGRTVTGPKIDRGEIRWTMKTCLPLIASKRAEEKEFRSEPRIGQRLAQAIVTVER